MKVKQAITSIQNWVRLAAVLSVLLVLTAVAAQARVGFKGQYINIFNLSPGESTQGTLELTALDEQEEQVSAYLMDFVTVPRAYRYMEVNSVDRSSSDWISFSPDRLQLAPGEVGEISYEINVPNDASLEGSYWTILMLEPSSPQELTGEEQFGFRQVVRYGVQFIINISGTGHPDLSINDLTVETRRATGSGEWVSRISGVADNRGNRAAMLTTKVEVFSEAGRSVGNFTGDKVMVVPGSAKDFSVVMPELEPGEYEALLVMESRDREAASVGTRFSFEIPEEPSLDEEVSSPSEDSPGVSPASLGEEGG